ncbi:sensor histidine kinase [Woodsholea maritima]|uniref:sensor histidine kinase n=1 Tax=Woodsholea maritima TaxID=240237 RepID=UPI00039A0E39|nr:HAMP domain-containing sensor histidine kinase [Woodsholea maritima]
MTLKDAHTHDMQARTGLIGRAWHGLGRALSSLPGKLLLLTIFFVMLAQVMIFIPSAASFRIRWLEGRAADAHLAILAVDAAGGMPVGDEIALELLSGVDAIAVSRVWDGFNELVLGTKTVPEHLIEADLDHVNPWSNMIALMDFFFNQKPRHILIKARPPSRPDELVFVIVPEAPLQQALSRYSRYMLGVSLFTSILTGGLIYISLLFLLVRPMRRLAKSMTAFQENPMDITRQITPSVSGDEIGEAEKALAEMQKDVRDALRQRERLAALGGAVAKINHDLRNVLASAQLMSDRLAMSRDQRTAALGERLVRAVNRGIGLCQDVLAYGRTSERAPVLDATPLGALLDEAGRDALEILGDAEWINAIEAEIHIEADREQAYRIFLNLFRNALQAMEGQEQRCLRVDAVVEGDEVRIQIEDCGPGIPERVRDSLFQAFGTSTRVGGSGLGLSIARELARNMGGDVRLVKTDERGSAFEVLFKRAHLAEHQSLSA